MYFKMFVKVIYNLKLYMNFYLLLKKHFFALYIKEDTLENIFLLAKCEKIRVCGD